MNQYEMIVMVPTRVRVSIPATLPETTTAAMRQAMNKRFPMLKDGNEEYRPILMQTKKVGTVYEDEPLEAA